MILHSTVWGAAGTAALLLAAAGQLVLRSRGLHIWIWPYIAGLRRRASPGSGPVHIMLCVADHYEPAVNGVTYERECVRVETWLREYPAVMSRHRDADGVRPQHTFFYPAEEYRAGHLDSLAKLCRAGYGDVEIHLHHDNDTAEGLRRKLEDFKKTLHETHGLLHFNPETQQVEYGFIHGNWALDNSGANGRNCGVNNELTVLRETGCYADFTLPSAPETAQTQKINSIYYAADDPLRPKSHNDGVDVMAGGPPSGDLMLIQGPLAL